MSRVPVLAAAALVALALPSPAAAKDRIVALTLAGRPVDRAGDVALLHGGVVYADVRVLVKAYSGLATYQGKKVVISVGPHVGTFTLGSRTMLIDDGSVVTAGDAFVRNGDVYVPLDAFVTVLAHGRVNYDASRTHADIVAENTAPT